MINYISELSKSPFIVSQPVSGGNFFDRDDIFFQIKDFVASDTKHVFLPDPQDFENFEGLVAGGTPGHEEVEW